MSSLNGRVESAAIPSAKKADLKDKISVLQVSKMTERLPYFSHIFCLLILICMKLVVNCFLLLETSDKSKKGD